MPCILKLYSGPLQGHTSGIGKSGHGKVGKVSDTLLPLDYDDSLPEGAFFSIYTVGDRFFLRREKGAGLKIFNEDDASYQEVKDRWQEMERRTTAVFGKTFLGIWIS